MRVYDYQGTSDFLQYRKDHRAHEQKVIAAEKTLVVIIGFIIGAFCFFKFEAWYNREYYANRCAGYGYEADYKTPLKVINERNQRYE